MILGLNICMRVSVVVVLHVPTTAFAYITLLGLLPLERRAFTFIPEGQMNHEKTKKKYVKTSLLTGTP
jgi:hypothetical protein